MFYTALYFNLPVVIETTDYPDYVNVIGSPSELPISDFEVLNEIPFDLWKKDSTGIKRVCPFCKGQLSLMTSINKKKCGDCATEFDWELDEGQESIL